MTTSDTHHAALTTATTSGILPRDPLRDEAIATLLDPKEEPQNALAAWLNTRQESVSRANTSVAALGLVMDLAAAYEDAGRHREAATAYEAAREAAWHERMDGVVRSLDEKLERMYAFGLASAPHVS